MSNSPRTFRSEGKSGGREGKVRDRDRDRGEGKEGKSSREGKGSRGEYSAAEAKRRETKTATARLQAQTRAQASRSPSAKPGGGRAGFLRNRPGFALGGLDFNALGDSALGSPGVRSPGARARKESPEVDVWAVYVPLPPSARAAPLPSHDAPRSMRGRCVRAARGRHYIPAGGDVPERADAAPSSAHPYARRTIASVCRRVWLQGRRRTRRRGREGQRPGVPQEKVGASAAPSAAPSATPPPPFPPPRRRPHTPRRTRSHAPRRAVAPWRGSAPATCDRAHAPRRPRRRSRRPRALVHARTDRTCSCR